MVKWVPPNPRLFETRGENVGNSMPDLIQSPFFLPLHLESLQQTHLFYKSSLFCADLWGICRSKPKFEFRPFL